MLPLREDSKMVDEPRARRSSTAVPPPPLAWCIESHDTPSMLARMPTPRRWFDGVVAVLRAAAWDETLDRTEEADVRIALVRPLAPPCGEDDASIPEQPIDEC